MTIWKKAELEKEISDALAKLMDDVYYGVRVKEYHFDGPYTADITLEIGMIVNGEISDLPSGYVAPRRWCISDENTVEMSDDERTTECLNRKISEDWRRRNEEQKLDEQ